MLLATLEAWRRGADEKDVLADVRKWNEAKRLEIEEWPRERIRQYEEMRAALRKAA
jgi:hypothetical protein